MSKIEKEDNSVMDLQKKSNRKAMNRNWSNQKANPALKTRTEFYQKLIRSSTP